ncbi:MAG TPA: YciI family protein [Dongiaceae bacterium]|jgi:hypothetical protein|nr:YciI family protein [Dongiaceae bacterium]
MARWVVTFDDTDGMLEVRKRHGPEHLAYLDANKDKILIGGGLRPAPGEPFVGGLWILEVADRAEAVRLIEADPYYRPEYRKYRVLAWGKAFEDRFITL